MTQRGIFRWFEERREWGAVFVRVLIGFHLMWGTQEVLAAASVWALAFGTGAGHLKGEDGVKSRLESNMQCSVWNEMVGSALCKLVL